MPQQPSQPRDYKLIVEKDVVVPLRDGAILYADVYRPDGGDGALPGHHEHRSLSEGQAVDSARRSRGESQSVSRPGRRPTRCGGARADMPACGSMRAAPASHPASPIPAPTRRRWTSTMRSSGSPGATGAPAISARWAFPTTPTVSGASPTCSRRRSRRSSRGKAAPTSIAIRPSTAASSRWAFSIPGSPPTWRTI